ncbi:unnamed protein product [Arabidopsis lyrata]|uniref:Predicted protein n=1 Tax=Arabidopsis lyrata subsp. lyrata TaxID=81972 RepID=D7MHY0_ARALL|nr:predicted protein [Arabidopsis lyrata subsp. lyrata]CAH8277148.1 unnamed protein product [Arabidopsis lyrata]
MSSSNNIEILRKWMYNRINPNTGLVSDEYEAGLTQFMDFANYRLYEGSRI